MTSQFKSPLVSFRQERFAQELAMGRSQGEAYALSPGVTANGKANCRVDPSRACDAVTLAGGRRRWWGPVLRGFLLAVFVFAVFAAITAAVPLLLVRLIKRALKGAGEPSAVF